jgi:hypothetical protein
VRQVSRLAGAALACAVVTTMAAPASADSPHQPTAVADTATTAAQTSVVVDVLANDSDPDGDALTLTGVSAPVHGTAAVAGTKVSYLPAAGFAGDDTFAYTVTDPSGLSASAVVTVTVAAAPNAAPNAAPDTASVEIGHTVTIPVLANDSDPDGNVLTLTGVTNGAHGVAAVAGQDVTYSPSPGTLGNDTFTYTVSDSAGASSTGTVVVTVTAQPAPKVARMAATVSGPLSRADVPYSYRPGCPVKPQRLRRISMNYYDYQGRVHRGRLIVSAAAVKPLLDVFRAGFKARFPLKKVKPTDVYYAKGKRSPSGSDVAAMKAGNTSAFNCRPVTGNPYRQSQHSYGNAIDINTFENPYVTSSRVYPSTARSYLNRSTYRTGMILRSGVLARTMRRNGWSWGARWAHPDYQHFSANGG